jgi:hypothetical protein
MYQQIRCFDLPALTNRVTFIACFLPIQVQYDVGFNAPISGLPDRLTFRLRQVKQPVLFLVFFDFDSSLSSDP